MSNLRMIMSRFRKTKELPSPDRLGVVFARIQSEQGGLVWGWARVLLRVFEAGQLRPRNRLTMRALGRQVGIAARGKPFSTPWVSRALAAARGWPKAPRSRADRVEFTQQFHGNTEKKERPAEGAEVRLRRAMERLRRAAVEAIELGCRRDAVLKFIDAALAGVQEVTEDKVTMSSSHGDAHEPGGRAPARQVSYARPRVLAG